MKALLFRNENEKLFMNEIELDDDTGEYKIIGEKSIVPLHFVPKLPSFNHFNNEDIAFHTFYFGASALKDDDGEIIVPDLDGYFNTDELKRGKFYYPCHYNQKIGFRIKKGNYKYKFWIKNNDIKVLKIRN